VDVGDAIFVSWLPACERADLIRAGVLFVEQYEYSINVAAQTG
jgi:hypothetical protein